MNKDILFVRIFGVVSIFSLYISRWRDANAIYALTFESDESPEIVK